MNLGTTLCLSIVWCNLAVSNALRRLNRRNGALRRISRASSKTKSLLAVSEPSNDVRMTPEERAFARLMALLSISFVVCWMPQMVSLFLVILDRIDHLSISRFSYRIMIFKSNW